MPVYARVTAMSCPPEAVETGIQFDRDEVTPDALAHDGCAGLLFLVNRTTGESLTISLWSSLVDLESSEDLGNRLRGASAELVQAQIDSISRYEVTLCTGIEAVNSTVDSLFRQERCAERQTIVHSPEGKWDVSTKRF